MRPAWDSRLTMLPTLSSFWFTTDDAGHWRGVPRTIDSEAKEEVGPKHKTVNLRASFSSILFAQPSTHLLYVFINLSIMASYENLPDFDSLPKVKDMPQGCAWGVFDKDGKKDVLGTVNLLTPDVVKAAASEVKEGVSVSLK